MGIRSYAWRVFAWSMTAVVWIVIAILIGAPPTWRNILGSLVGSAFVVLVLSAALNALTGKSRQRQRRRPRHRRAF